MISYTIRHPHPRQKEEAIETLKQVIDALEIRVTIPEPGDKATIKLVKGWYEASVIQSKQSLSAVIHTYNRDVVDLELPYLDTTIAPDRYDSIDF